MALLSAKGDWPKCLFLRDELSDCEIIVQNPLSSQRFPCHRVILCAASEVFATMFQHGFKEGETGKIIIEDVNPDVMFSILKYIYYGRISFGDWKEAVDILRASHKYSIAALCDKCETFLAQNLTIENVCTVLELATLYDFKNLEYVCLDLCRKGCFAILRTKAFMELSTETVKRILHMEELNVEHEMVVFNAIWEWAILECCRKKEKVTEETIAQEISVFLDCVGFEFMTDAEINTLPKAVLQKYCITSKKLKHTNKAGKAKQDTETGNRSNADNKELTTNILISKVLKARKAIFPLHLEDYLIIFKTTISYKTNTCIKGNHTFLRFSVDCDVYLNSVTIICLKDSYPNNVLSSLHVSSMEGTLASYSKQESDNLSFNETGPHAISKKDPTQVQEIIFAATKHILMKSGIEFTLEVNRDNSSQNCGLTWPEVIPTDHISGNVCVEGCRQNILGFAMTHMQHDQQALLSQALGAIFPQHQ